MHFLLVHGTTQSPEGWRLLIDELNALGHTAATTDLMRYGERLCAAEYGDAVAAEHSGSTIDVVVAHSGCGLLLPAITLATRAAVQVYLAAFVPDGSRSLMDEVNHDAGALFGADWIGTDPTTNHDDARRFLFHDCQPDVAEWAMTTLRSFVPVAVFSERVAPAVVVPTVSIVPAGDRTLRPAWMMSTSKNRLGVEATVVPGGHCPHVSRPRALATVLAALLDAQ